MDKRVLIVGTVPYNEKMTSRAFDAYFHFWDKKCLRQIFSNPNTPSKGHCSSLYQITDYRLLKRWFNSKVETGIIYNYEKLDNESNVVDEEKKSKIGNLGYKIGLKHNSFTHLMRGLLWRKKFWCTDKLNVWLDEYKPQVIFLAFSDDFFINSIALYVSNKYNIPIVSCIGDDYILNRHFSINPFYLLYKYKYNKVIKKVFNRTKRVLYISDKIKEKYNKEFNLKGDTVYLSSNIIRKPFKVINEVKPIITYFGNIRMGRNESLCELSEVFKSINNNYIIEVYSNEKEKKYYSLFEKYSNIKYMGSIPYPKVKERMNESDITVVVEGFRKNDIDCSRYSLSTKAADALASGSQIVVYGSMECGVIEYMNQTKAAIVGDNKEDIKIKIKKLVDSEELQNKLYNQAISISNKNHSLKNSCKISKKLICDAINEGVK